MNRRTYIRQAIALAAFAVVMPLGTGVSAKDSDAVNVDVRVIRVSTEGAAHVDSKLDDIKPKLLKAFDGYKKFLPMSRTKAGIKRGTTHSFSLPDGTQLRITPEKRSGNELRLGIELGKKFRTKVRVSPGNTFFQAGLPYKGDILVIAITAR